MKFHLDSDRLAIQQTIADVLRDHCTSQRRRVAIEAGRVDEDLWRALMGVGLGGLWADERYGGVGLGVLEMALALETIGAHAAPGPFMPHALAVRAISLSGENELKERWLGELVTGARKAALLFGPGWTPDVWDARVADGAATGEFPFAHGAAEAEVYVIAAAEGLFLVEAKAAGVSLQQLAGSDPSRPISHLSLREAPAAPLADRKTAADLFDTALTLLAADALGGAGACLDIAVSYAKTREQFGVVIASFQALKHQLANIALEVEPSRALVWYAAHAQDASLADAPRAAAHAKAHLADRFVSAARASIQAHGGIGYTWDYDLQIWFRRSLFDRAYLGAPSLHRERAAAMAGW